MSTTIKLWFWEIRDPVSGRWRKTTYRMTDGDARERFGAEARKIEGTQEVRCIDLTSNSTGSFLRSVRPRP